MGRVGREIERIGRAALPVIGAAVGGMMGGPAGAAAGYSITSGTMNALDTPDTPSAVNNASVADPSLSTPTTPENSPTQIGAGDGTDTGFGDVVSIFNQLTQQEDEWDKFLGRYITR